MLIAIKVKTPKGAADGTNKKLRWFILGKTSKHIKKVHISPDDDEFTWIIECDYKRYIKISKNVLYYDTMVSQIFDNKVLKKTINRAISEEQQKELLNMLHNQTTIDIKVNPSEEEVEKYYGSLWQRIKSKLF